LVLPRLTEHGVHVSSIGKIYDLYNGAGIVESHTSRNNGRSSWYGDVYSTGYYGGYGGYGYGYPQAPVAPVQ